MTDILLRHRGIGAVAVCEPNICCIEVGTVKTPTCSITIGGVVQKWPQKLGEVLASMYLFGALNYVNSLTTTPDKISFTALIMRSILLRLVVDDTGCNVHEKRMYSMLSMREEACPLRQHWSTSHACCRTEHSSHYIETLLGIVTYIHVQLSPPFLLSLHVMCPHITRRCAHKLLSNRSCA